MIRLPTAPAALAYAWTAGPLPALLLLSCAGLALSASAMVPALPGFCGALGLAAVGGSLGLVPRFWPPEALVAAWAIMLLAMMPPLLVQPIGHVAVSLFRARRRRGVATFALGYAIVWLAAGALLVPVAVALALIAPGAAAGGLALLGAVLWSCSPAAQAARNRCHRVRRLAPFGSAADRDCLAYGLATGAACFVACAPWMVVALSVGQGHAPAMAAITLLLFLDRLAPARPPHWQLPPAGDWIVDAWRGQKVFGRL